VCELDSDLRSDLEGETELDIKKAHGLQPSRVLERAGIHGIEPDGPGERPDLLPGLGIVTRGALFCSSSARLVAKPSASWQSGVRALVASTRVVPATPSPISRSTSSRDRYGTARMIASPHAAASRTFSGSLPHTLRLHDIR
jgi:hypothetical protein